MNRKTILTGIAAFATTMAFGVAAQAAATSFQWEGGASGNWNDPAEWRNLRSFNLNDGYPDAAEDTAIFNSNSSATIVVTLTQNDTVGHFDILDGRSVTLSASSSQKRLDLTAGAADGKLIVDGSSALNLGAYVTMAFNSAVTHENGGFLALTSQTNDAIIEVNANAVFGPYSGTYGSIKGEDAGSQIQIVANATLTNQITLEGMMQVLAQSGTATLANNRVAASAASGLVNANAGGVFLLDASVKLTDSNSGSDHARWRASVSSGSILRFDRAADGSDGAHPKLVGDFEMFNCAKINANLVFVWSSGGVTNFAGTIQAPFGRLKTDSTTAVDVNGTSSSSGGC